MVFVNIIVFGEFNYAVQSLGESVMVLLLASLSKWFRDPIFDSPESDAGHFLYVPTKSKQPDFLSGCFDFSGHIQHMTCFMCDE
jgi:hypothetical protein